jgi:hypothetical protein
LSDDLVTIAAYSSPFEAHIVQGRLESEGIESFIQDEATAQNLTAIFGTDLAGYVRLQVRESDRERALEILALADEDLPDENVEDTEQ